MMIRSAIISLAAVLGADLAMAQDQAGEALFAEKHMAFVTSRCPSEVTAYEALMSGHLYAIFESAPDVVFGADMPTEMKSTLSAAAASEMSVSDVHQSTVMVMNIVSLGHSVKFGSLFSPEVDIAEGEIAETYDDRKARVLASIELLQCVWPTQDERDALANSSLAGTFEKIAAGLCDKHIYTLFKRFIETPIAGMSPAEREATRLKILADHDTYMEVSKDPSQCGEFL